MSKHPDVILFVRYFIFGLFFAAAIAILAMAGPPVVMQRADWFDGGLRLFRDDAEIKVYWSLSDWIPKAVAPYSPGSPQDYPPLGVLFFSWPTLFVSDFSSFRSLFVASTVVCYAGLLGLMAVLLRRTGRSGAYALLMLLPAFAYFSLWRFDILPALFVAAAMVALHTKKFPLAMAMMFMAVLAKWYAALFFLPLFMLVGSGFGRKDGRDARMAALVLGGVALASVLVLVLTSGFGSIAAPVLFHLQRDFENGALGTYVMAVLGNFGTSALTVMVVSTFMYVLQFGAAVPLALFGSVRSFGAFVRACVFLLIPFMLFGHFFSAQWIVWLTPILLLVSSRKETVLLGILDLALFLSFPILFGINPFSWAYHAASLLRIAILATLWGLNLRAMVKEKILIRSRV